MATARAPEISFRVGSQVFSSWHQWPGLLSSTRRQGWILIWMGTVMPCASSATHPQGIFLPMRNPIHVGQEDSAVTPQAAPGRLSSPAGRLVLPLAPLWHPGRFPDR